MKKSLLLLLFGCGIIFLQFYWAGFEQILAVVSELSISWMFVALFFYGLSWIFRSWRLGLFFSSYRTKVGYKELFSCQIAGCAMNNILPVKMGDVMTIAFFKKRDLPFDQSTTVVVHSRVMDLFALIMLPLIFYSFSKHSLSYQYTSYYATLSIMIALFSILFFGLIIQNRYLNSFFIYIESIFDYVVWKKICRFGLKVVSLYEDIAKDKMLWISSLFISCLIWVLEGLTTYLLSVALSISIPFSNIMIAVAIGNLGKGLPSTPGSIGVYESILAFYLLQCGIPFDKAIVLSTLDHLLKKAFVLSFGVPVLLKTGGYNAK